MHDEETPAEKVGYFIALIGTIIPSLIVSGFMGDWNVLPLWGWVAIAGLSGGIGVAIPTTPRIAAFIGGLIGGGCIPLATIAYVELRIQLSDTFLNVELVIPAFIGALPGTAAYFILERSFKPWGDDDFSSTDNPTEKDP